MSPKQFSLIAAIGLFSVSCINSATNHSDNRPNIIFIMSDDHAYQALSAYSPDLMETPNIDRIADKGIQFNKAFVTNSICAPSRAVILTGKFSHLNGVLGNGEVFDGNQQTFPKILQQYGYQTAMIGKWHLKSAPTGFDYWNVLPGQGDYYNPDFLVQNPDIAPTILDVAGVTVPDDMQGRSLRSTWNGNASEWRKAVYYHYYEKSFGAS